VALELDDWSDNRGAGDGLSDLEAFLHFIAGGAE
jgi:hypothetical protein